MLSGGFAQSAFMMKPAFPNGTAGFFMMQRRLTVTCALIPH